MTKQKDPNRFYVYLHRRGDNNEVFYVGKGCGKRAIATKGRNSWWTRVYEKYGRVVEYLEKGLTQDDALALEMETILFYRACGHQLCNLTGGGDGGVDGPKRKAMKTANTAIINFYNHNTCMAFRCTQSELYTTYGVCESQASRLVNGKIKSTGGISLEAYKDDPLGGRDDEIYEFIHLESGKSHFKTRVQMRDEFNLPLNLIYYLVKGKTRICMGFALATTRNFQHKDTARHELKNVFTGDIIIRTALEMQDEYGVNSGALSRILKGKGFVVNGFALPSTPDDHPAILNYKRRKNASFPL